METKTDKLLNNINGFPLDYAQRKVVTSNKKHLLVSAGAGSGKTLTIIGKIRYLIEIKNLSFIYGKGTVFENKGKRRRCRN